MDNIQMLILFLVLVVLFVCVLVLLKVNKKKESYRTAVCASVDSKEKFVYLMQRKLDNGFMDLKPVEVFEAMMSTDGSMYQADGFSFSNPAKKLAKYWVKVDGKQYEGLVGPASNSIGWNTGNYMFRIEKLGDWMEDAIPKECNFSCQNFN